MTRTTTWTFEGPRRDTMRTGKVGARRNNLHLRGMRHVHIQGVGLHASGKNCT